MRGFSEATLASSKRPEIQGRGKSPPLGRLELGSRDCLRAERHTLGRRETARPGQTSPIARRFGRLSERLSPTERYDLVGSETGTLDAPGANAVTFGQNRVASAHQERDEIPFIRS